jgi:hypothetical protein
MWLMKGFPMHAMEKFYFLSEMKNDNHLNGTYTFLPDTIFDILTQNGLV